MGSSAYDGDGLATRASICHRRRFIDYVLSLYSANRLGLNPLLMLGVRNLFLKATTISDPGFRDGTRIGCH